MKKNTQLFNTLIEKQIADGEIINVDMTKYREKSSDEIPRNTVGNLKTLLTNKLKGGKRTSPQEKSEIKKGTDKDTPLFKCPQCDFISQNSIFFNEHVSNAHSGQPTCPFCFHGFQDLPSLRKHCDVAHKEGRS